MKKEFEKIMIKKESPTFNNIDIIENVFKKFVHKQHKHIFLILDVLNVIFLNGLFYYKEESIKLFYIVIKLKTL